MVEVMAQAGVFNTVGKLLLTKRVNENEIDATMNIQHLSEGVYFVSFSINGHKQFTQKFIKLKSN
jgi:YbbR domain-containing protein